MSFRSPSDVKREALVEHVLSAALRLAVDDGLGVTMDRIADASGVSRSTLFRLFDSRDRLLGEAFTSAIADYGRRLPAYEGDLDAWLRSTCEAAHRMNAGFGPGYWELTSRADLAPELTEAERRRRGARRELMAGVTRTLWRGADGQGDPPQPLLDAVATHLSAHFTAAVVRDASREWPQAAAYAHDAILSALQRCRGAGPPHADPLEPTSTST